MIKLKPYHRQSRGFCGPASLKMVLDYYGLSVSEAEIAKISGASPEEGISVPAKILIKAAKHFGFHAFVKERGSFDNIEYFIKRKIPVIVDWFLVDDGHYSVVVDINEKNIVLMDPILRKVLIYVRRRKMPPETFLRVWFDFPENFITKPDDIILRLMLVVTPFKEKFPMPGKYF